MKRKLVSAFTSILILLIVCLSIPVTAAGDSSGTTSQPDLQQQIDSLSQTLKEFMKQQSELQQQWEEQGGNNTSPEPETPSSLRPNLLISGYEFGADHVTGGQTFTLNFRLYNTSKNIAIKNAVIKLSGGDAFSQANGADTLYVENIGARKTISQSMQFNCGLNTATGAYPITASIAYEYYDAGAKADGSAELSMTIPVIQEDKIQLNNVSFSAEEIYAGEECEVVYTIINSGFTKLYNATAKLCTADGEELASSYLGTIDPGTQTNSNSDLYLVFQDVGEQTLTFQLAYENEALEPKTISQEITANVIEYVNPYPEDPDINPTPEEDDGFSVIAIIIVVVVLLIAGGATAAILIIRKKRKQRSVTEDEDL